MFWGGSVSGTHVVLPSSTVAPKGGSALCESCKAACHGWGAPVREHMDSCVSFEARCGCVHVMRAEGMCLHVCVVRECVNARTERQAVRPVQRQIPARLAGGSLSGWGLMVGPWAETSLPS